MEILGIAFIVIIFVILIIVDIKSLLLSEEEFKVFFNKFYKYSPIKISPQSHIKKHRRIIILRIVGLSLILVLLLLDAILNG